MRSRNNRDLSPFDRYIDFASEMNRNISNMIHLSNNIRYNLYQVYNSTFETSTNNINDIWFPPPSSNILPPPPPPPRRRRPPSRRVRTRVMSQDLDMNWIRALVNDMNPISRRNSVLTSTRHPTRTQINEATEVMLYQDISSHHNFCPITQGRFQDNDSIMRIKHCGHIFKEESLRRWFITSYQCPTCRYDIRENVADSSQNTFLNSPSHTHSIVDASGGDISNNTVFNFEYSIALTHPSLEPEPYQNPHSPVSP